MTRPRLHIETTSDLTREMEPGTLMIHNEPPAMIVIVTATDGEQVGDFTGTVLDTGVHLNSFIKSEFTFFEGTLTLTQ